MSQKVSKEPNKSIALRRDNDDDGKIRTVILLHRFATQKLYTAGTASWPMYMQAGKCGQSLFYANKKIKLWPKTRKRGLPFIKKFFFVVSLHGVVKLK